MSKQGLVISVEGISGVGKSYLSGLLRSTYPDLPLMFVSEIPEWHGDCLGSRITRLLKESGDLFFRNDYPLTTTFLLLASAMYREETRIRALSDGGILLKDRSIDSLAIYQAILLFPHSFEQQLLTAHRLYAMAAQWSTPPDLTFLIEDDFEAALHRAEVRNQRAYPEDERALLRMAHRLYDAYASSYQPRIVRVARQQMQTDEVLQYIRRQILTKLQSMDVPALSRRGGNHVS